MRQVITFDPPVASWSFAAGHQSDELWKELTQATSHLMLDYPPEAEFTQEVKDKLRARILVVLLYWVSQHFLSLPEGPQAAQAAQ